MRLVDFIANIGRAGYTSVDNYCNANSLNYDDIFGVIVDTDDDFAACNDDDYDDDDGWTGFESY